jgi:hypothetical protein
MTIERIPAQKRRPADLRKAAAPVLNVPKVVTYLSDGTLRHKCCDDATRNVLPKLLSRDNNGVLARNRTYAVQK